MKVNNLIRKGILRWGALFPLVGFVIWVILTPMMATIWNIPRLDIDRFWEQTPYLVRTVGWFLVRQGMDLRTEEIYFSVGRYFFLVYLSMIVGLYAFHNYVKSKKKMISKFTSVSYKVLLISLIIVTIGDFTSYGLGVFSDFLWSIGFGVEILAFLFVLLSSIWYGILLIRSKDGFSASGGVLIGGALLAPFFAFEEVFISYIPNGPVLPYILAWSILGISVFRKQKVM